MACIPHVWELGPGDYTQVAGAGTRKPGAELLSIFSSSSSTYIMNRKVPLFCIIDNSLTV